MGYLGINQPMSPMRPPRFSGESNTHMQCPGIEIHSNSNALNDIEMTIWLLDHQADPDRWQLLYRSDATFLRCRTRTSARR